MMKKLLVLVLVFGMASAAWAIPYFDVNAVDKKDHYSPSDVITINVYDNTANASGLAGFMIDCITDNNGGTVLGTAAEPQVFNATFPTGLQFPGTLNVSNQLVEYASASVGAGATITLPGFVYSFEYHVPDLPTSTWIEIEAHWDYDWYMPPKFDYGDDTFYRGPVTPLLIHVVPEPATIALVGLGGLLLRRRK